VRALVIPVLPAFLVLAVAALTLLGDLRQHFAPFAVIAVSATAALYFAAWRSDRGATLGSTRTIITVAILLRLAALPMTPSLSDDAWRYLWDGRLELHGVNPYVVAPSDPSLRWAHDELYRLQGHPGTSTVYPPAAQLLFAIGAMPMTFGASPLFSYYALKLLLVAIDIGAVLVLLRLLERLGRPRAWAMLYAWHPLVVIEIAGQGHSDALWVASILLALFALVNRRRHRGVPWLVAGGLARLHPLALLPLWWRVAGTRRWLAGLLWSLPLLGLLIPLMEPRALAAFVTVVSRFTNYYEFNGGFYYALKWVADALAVARSNRIAGGIAVAVQLAVILVATLRARGDDPVRLVSATLVVTFALVALGAKAHVWYFIAPLALVALDPRGPLARAVLWVTFVAPLTYVAYSATPFGESTWVLWLEWGGAAAITAGAMLLERKRQAAGDTMRDASLSDRLSATEAPAA
jgi:alpha-1,6-mannosyltransferase